MRKIVAQAVTGIVSTLPSRNSVISGYNWDGIAWSQKSSSIALTLDSRIALWTAHSYMQPHQLWWIDSLIPKKRLYLTTGAEAANRNSCRREWKVKVASRGSTNRKFVLQGVSCQGVICIVEVYWMQHFEMRQLQEDALMKHGGEKITSASTQSIVA